MSVDWSFHILVARGALTASRLASLVQEAEELGLEPSGLELKEIVVMGADGSGSLIFSTAEAAVEWLGSADGLLELMSRDSSERLGLSLHRCAGILPIEMVCLPDEPHFDVCRLTASETDLRSPHREKAWKVLEALVTRAVQLFEPTFLYGIDDNSLEAQMPFLCIHNRVAAGRLPPALAWVMGAPRHSELANQILSLAETLNRPAMSIGDLTALKLTDLPWEATPDAIGAAARTWRTVSHDPGCGA